MKLGWKQKPRVGKRVWQGWGGRGKGLKQEDGDGWRTEDGDGGGDGLRIEGGGGDRG